MSNSHEPKAPRPAEEPEDRISTEHPFRLKKEPQVVLDGDTAVNAANSEMMEEKEF
ncbi:hypothetical protein MJA45_27725 [Paenibacillus aurantius]|uniref:Uncharacterized protein n=1 Tax=Paenibacillus aurantius TaxID=2918900 RepID=A0AA96LE55_9BACL|nr:hypothetical protein [Paenibacillus aurantius]WNQ11343.1 hypothetical protein MJA45_27725 [Paenibacillus aurantius]